MTLAHAGAPARERAIPTLDRWRDLPPFNDEIRGEDQVLLIAATGGAKSTLVATMTLHTPSLVALDEKDALKLPRARIVSLPARDSLIEHEPDAYYRHVARAIAWRDTRGTGDTNRVILRPNVLDIDGFEAHNDIFHAIYDRRAVITWIDEITATGATSQRVQPWLKGISARGRTRHVGLWTCTQAPFSLTPTILRRNATYLIFGPLDEEDARDIPRRSIELAVSIPRKSGRFIVYKAGERDPYRLYLPIPDVLAGWKAP